MDPVSERLATLADRFAGSDEDGEMILDRLAYTTIAAVLMDCADDAAILEQRLASKSPPPVPDDLTDAPVVDLESYRMQRELRPSA